MSPSQSPSPASQSPNSRGSGQQPQRRPLIPVWIWWALLVALLVWNVYAFFFQKGSPPSVALSYSDFLNEVRAGAVATVTIHGQNVDGTFTQAVTWPPPGAAATPAPGTATATPTPSASSQSGTPDSYTHFTTVLPSFPDDQLLPLLEQQAVTVSAKASSSGPSWLLELGLNLLPLLLFVGVLVLMGRRLQSGQQSVFSFGSSRARKYNGEHPDVTFADVAGEEEAKGELQEVVGFLRQPEHYRAVGARLPRGVLLVGPAGTGKTLLARAVADEASVPFFSISASEFVELFVGVGASRVRDLFAQAKQAAPAIVFVDELDAVGRQRGQGWAAATTSGSRR